MWDTIRAILDSMSPSEISNSSPKEIVKQLYQEPKQVQECFSLIKYIEQLQSESQAKWLEICSLFQKESKLVDKHQQLLAKRTIISTDTLKENVLCRKKELIADIDELDISNPHEYSKKWLSLKQRIIKLERILALLQSAPKKNND